jgi:6-phosphogluconolactonase
MKMKLFMLCLLSVFLICHQAEAKKHILYVGTYTKGTTDGIFAYSFNDQTGRLVNLKIPTICNNPSFLAISANRKFLYAVSELNNMGINQSGGISAFSIERKNNLKLINQVLTNGANPCHLVLSPDGKLLVASNYTGGNLSVFNILPDGSLSDMVQRIQNTGAGPVKGRQDEPHVHSAQFDSSGKLLFAADLGIDELKIYNVATGETPLTAHALPFISLPPGSGPRHFDFSDDGRFIYVINELNSTIAVFIKYGGEWKSIQTIKTLPKDFKGENSCADIHISPDGRTVYGSNRGHNSIAVFKRDVVGGKLEMVQTIPVEGNWPRNFTLDPSGRFLLCANQKSNDITVFRIDQPSGKLSYTGFKVPNESPVCLKFLN